MFGSLGALWGGSRAKKVSGVAAKVLRHCVQMKRRSLREWIPIFPWPVWPLAGHARLGQNVAVGSMLVLRRTLGNVPGGVWLYPRLSHKTTSPRLTACHYPKPCNSLMSYE